VTFSVDNSAKSDMIPLFIVVSTYIFSHNAIFDLFLLKPKKIQN
jgi:hypothetical protein